MNNALPKKNFSSNYLHKRRPHAGPTPAGTARPRRSPELLQQARIAYLAALEVLG